MSVLWRILSVAALVVSAGVLILSVLSVRKESRVRPGLDLARLAITLATTLLMARLVGVTTSETLMGAGLLVGLILGVYEGLHLRIRFLGSRTFARRTVLGVAAWGAGVVVVQAAGVIGRIGLADLGLTLSFLGIGQVIGLLAGRWQTVLTARRAGAGAVAVLVAATALGCALLPLLGAPAGAVAPVDLRSVMAGDVPGLAVEVRGNGSFFGPALSLTFTNDTGGEAVVTVPLGLLFLPEDEAVQTMVGAGAETITVPAGTKAQVVPVDIQAFCAQFPDHIPSSDDVFHAGEVAAGKLAAVVAVIHAEGVYGRDQQEAVWSITDGNDISQNEAAAAVVAAAEEVPEGDLGGIFAVDDDSANLMWGCTTNRAFFADPSEDRSRCLTFRYAVPEEGIESAVVYLSIAVPTASLQDTDAVAVAVGAPFPDQCDLAGDMAGCVRVHGGFAGGETALTVDLLDLACDPSFSGSQEMQDAVRAELAAGVLHLLVQDDTAVLAGRLALNEGPPALACGTSTAAAPVAGIVPCRCSEMTAGEGARTSFVGLGGAAALLVTALAGSGNSLAAAAGAWRSGGAKALADMFRGASGTGARAAAYIDPPAALSAGRAGAVLDALPADLRSRVHDALAARLETEQSGRLLTEVRRILGPLDPAADAGELLRKQPGAASLLERVPAGARSRWEEKILGGLQEQQAAAAAEEAVLALRRDHAVGLLRRAIEQGDGPAVQRVLAACGEEGPTRVWPRAVAGLETQAARLEYPAAGAGAPPLDLDQYLDAGGEAAAALPAGGEAESLLARLSPGVRPQAQGGLAGRLDAARLHRWVEKLRAAAAGAGAGSGPRPLLEVPEVQRVLGTLPPGLRERIGEAAARVVDEETVAGLARAARRLVEHQRAAELLRVAVGLGDGDRADAVMGAVQASLDVAGRADLDKLARRVTEEGAAALQRLTRSGAPVPPVDLTEHLAGAADLLSAARRSEGVEALLQQAGPLRSRVEAELVRALEAGRVERAVRRAAELAGPQGRAASDALDVVAKLPGVRELLDGLPAPARREARRLLAERLEAERVDAAVATAERALHLDQAEDALRRAALVGDLEAADAALAGMAPQEAEAVARAAGVG